MTVQGVESAAAIFTALIFWNSNCCGCFRQRAAPSTSLKNLWPALSAQGLVRMAADRGKGEEAGPEGRDPSAQREDQLQGAGALAGEDPGAHRRRPQGGEREYCVRPSLGLERAIDDGRGRGDCSADQGGHAAGFAEGWIKKASRTRGIDLDQYSELRYDGALADDGKPDQRGESQFR
jgi:hypothetical protein